MIYINDVFVLAMDLPTLKRQVQKYTNVLTHLQHYDVGCLRG